MNRRDEGPLPRSLQCQVREVPTWPRCRQCRLRNVSLCIHQNPHLHFDRAIDGISRLARDIGHDLVEYGPRTRSQSPGLRNACANTRCGRCSSGCAIRLRRNNAAAASKNGRLSGSAEPLVLLTCDEERAAAGAGPEAGTVCPSGDDDVSSDLGTAFVSASP